MEKLKKIIAIIKFIMKVISYIIKSYEAEEIEVNIKRKLRNNEDERVYERKKGNKRV